MVEFSFIADGHERVRAAIRQELHERHAEWLSSASFFGRMRIYWIIEREVVRRAELEAPPYALY